MASTQHAVRLVAAAAVLLAACSGAETAPAATDAPTSEAAPTSAAPAPDVSRLPAGDYTLDPSHASLTFKVNHLGFSRCTAQFRTFTADLRLDPANPEKASVRAAIDLKSLSLPNPPAGFVEELLGDQWLGMATTPQMIFESTSVTLTGPATEDVVGNLTLKGVTRPVTLHAAFNGGYDGHPMDPHARIGFSAHGVLRRSDFGVSLGIPAPGSTMGVFDEVAFEIEAEFTGPAWQVPATSAQ